MTAKRSPKGLPAITTSNNRLQVRGTYQGKRYTISVGMPDTREGRNLAERIRLKVEADISLGLFDQSLKTYREMTTVKSSVCEVPEVFTLDTLWNKYIEFKKPQVEVTTYEMKYPHVSKWIDKLPSRSLDDAIAIRDFLLKETSPSNAKYLLSQFSGCCKWAVKSGLTENNPFDKLGTDITIKHSENSDIDPFSRTEMQTIVEAFESDHYYSFVRFLFMTGCRTSEAIGLRWKRINLEAGTILFDEAIVKVGGSYRSKGLKTQESRKFPINATLREFLISIKPEDVDLNEFVFKPTERTITKHINRSTFHDNHWEPIINRLAHEGKIERYRSQYNTRHTFITLALQAGVDVSTVARWVGNSPETIYKHYAGHDKDSLPPEF